MGSGMVVDLMAAGDETENVIGDLWAEGRGAVETEEEWEAAATAKQRGEAAEAAFVAKASRLGFGVAKPWGDSDRYDFIVDAGDRLRRVQVKSAYRAGEDGGYSFHAHGHTLIPYGENEIYALVAYVVPEDAWYVFPVKIFRSVCSLRLFPGTKRKRSKFERFREAWWILRGRKRK